jgi:hypothetical protein
MASLGLENDSPNTPEYPIAIPPIRVFLKNDFLFIMQF